MTFITITYTTCVIWKVIESFRCCKGKGGIIMHLTSYYYEAQCNTLILQLSALIISVHHNNHILCNILLRNNLVSWLSRWWSYFWFPNQSHRRNLTWLNNLSVCRFYIWLNSLTTLFNLCLPIAVVTKYFLRWK